ncbi:MAG TPA: hypothetical protein PKY59_01215 [Pyrinomonadaceae bacterium]|nr:hypothetical protein [Pyrinomonadaceae bacterium]
MLAFNGSREAKPMTFACTERPKGSKGSALCPQIFIRGKQRAIPLPAINASRKAKDNPFARKVRQKESKGLTKENRKPFVAGNQQIKEKNISPETALLCYIEGEKPNKTVQSSNFSLYSAKHTQTKV